MKRFAINCIDIDRVQSTTQLFSFNLWITIFKPTYQRQTKCQANSSSFSTKIHPLTFACLVHHFWAFDSQKGLIKPLLSRRIISFMTNYHLCAHNPFHHSFYLITWVRIRKKFLTLDTSAINYQVKSPCSKQKPMLSTIPIPHLPSHLELLKILLALCCR